MEVVQKTIYVNKETDRRLLCCTTVPNFSGFQRFHVFALMSAIGRHLEQHGLLRTDLVDKQLSVLKKRRSKFDCLIFMMLFIKELNPKSLFAPNYLRDSVCEYLVTTYFHFLFVSL